MTMLEETIRLVRESDESPARIAKNCGLKSRWLYRLLDGDYADPGVNKIERLRDYLLSQSNTRPAA